MKMLTLLLVVLPGVAQAQIFRCEAEGESYFSQIPCAENSQAVVIEDRLMFSEASPAAEKQNEEPEPPVERVKTQAENMQDFVSTLYRQRTEQLQEIDKNIADLESQLNKLGDVPPDDPQRQGLTSQLIENKSSRESIVDQYQSMISEAERRVAALSGKERTARGQN